MTDALQRQPESTPDHDEPDYAAIEPPTDIPRSELHYTHRRAEIHDIIMSTGHPSAVSNAELADRFDVDPSTISRDISRINEYLRQNAGARRDLESHAVYRRAIRGLLVEGEYREAARVQKWFDEFRDGRVQFNEFRNRLDRLENVAEEPGGASRP